MAKCFGIGLVMPVSSSSFRSEWRAALQQDSSYREDVSNLPQASSSTLAGNSTRAVNWAGRGSGNGFQRSPSFKSPCLTYIPCRRAFAETKASPSSMSSMTPFGVVNGISKEGFARFGRCLTCPKTPNLERIKDYSGLAASWTYSSTLPISRSKRSSVLGGKKNRTISRARRRGNVVCRLPMVVETEGFPAFLPREVKKVKEVVAIDMARRIQRLPVQTNFWDDPIPTSFVGPSRGSEGRKAMPILLLHGFDSSCLEYRRLHPRLSEGGAEVWAFDIFGWGFSETPKGLPQLGPEEKREHLFHFWKTHIQRPMLLVGASLGGAVALDFALTYPQAVAKLALIDAQGFSEGLGNMAKLPDFLAYAGVAVLKSSLLRSSASRMSYNNPKTFATSDATMIGSLHCFMPGWAEAQVKFIRSGGYKLGHRIPYVTQPTLIIWGENDAVIPTSVASLFADKIRNSSLTWVPDSGHCPHLEKPSIVSDRILDFLAE